MRCAPLAVFGVLLLRVATTWAADVAETAMCPLPHSPNVVLGESSFYQPKGFGTCDRRRTRRWSRST
jgi:hypothetical protein